MQIKPFILDTINRDEFFPDWTILYPQFLESPPPLIQIDMSHKCMTRN